jgi:hypothetical protein
MAAYRAPMAAYKAREIPERNRDEIVDVTDQCPNVTDGYFVIKFCLKKPFLFGTSGDSPSLA